MKLIINNKVKYYILPFVFLVTIILIVLSSNFTSSTTAININKKVESKVFDNYTNDYLFVFFGYVGCVDICTPRLTELSLIYDQLKEQHKIDIDMAFINITKLRDKELPQLFASAFNKDFDGFYLNDDKINLLKKEFSVYSSPSISSRGEYDHTSFLFLLKKDEKDYYLRKIYTNSPFDKQQIIGDITRGIK